MQYRPYQLEYINNIQLDKSNLVISTMRKYTLSKTCV